MQSIIKIFCGYLRVNLGSSFFIQTLSFVINSSLETCTLKDLLYLTVLSDEKYFNRYDFNYSDLFPNIHLHFNKYINEIEFADLFVLWKGFVNLNLNKEKKLILNLITITLKYLESFKFQELVLISNFIFELLTTSFIINESEVFLNKFKETFRLNLKCLESSLLGFNDLKDMHGIHDKKHIEQLEKIVI